MAYLRFEPQSIRTRVSIVSSRKVNGAAVQTRVGNLGSFVVAKALSVSERVRFWEQLAGRFAKIEAKLPGRLSAEDVARFEAAINERIKRPARAAAPSSFFQEIGERQRRRVSA